jgi:hypothetical protein
MEESIKALYRRLDAVQIKKAMDDKLDALYTVYRNKNRRTITVNPFKRQIPPVFFMIQQEPVSVT